MFSVVVVLIFLTQIFFSLAQTTTTTAAPTISPRGQRCQSQKFNGDYKLPYGLMMPGQTCVLSFYIPSGSMAFMDLKADNMTHSLEEPAKSEIIIQDIFGNVIKNLPNPDLSIAWPSNFTIYVKVDANETNMFMGIEIQYKPNMVNAKTLALNTQTNGSSKVYFLNQMKEGNTYVATSLTRTGISVATAKLVEKHEGIYDFMNIFVYDNGIFKGTLNTLGSYYGSYGNTVQLYVARASTKIFRGAFLITDTSNLPPSNCYLAAYVPFDVPEHLFPVGDCTGKWGALTIIGDPDGSTPYDVEEVHTSGGKMVVTQYIGGPIPNAKGTVLDDETVPEEVVDILTTFNIVGGWGSIRVTTDPNK